jgi:3-oxoacyl-[acyl-carrier protein] reductase
MPNFKRFEGQVAVVTGAASGIGAGVAQRLAEEGAQVVLVDNNADLLDTQTGALQNAGLKADSLVLDITAAGAVQAAMSQIAQQYGRLDVLVNSAGIVGPTATKIVEYSVADFQQVVAVNLTGAFLVTKYAIEQMLPRNYGRILLISSIGGKEGNPGMAGYAASKSGVMGLVKGIGKEYAGTGITINGLAPAVIATPMNLQTDPEMMAYMTSKIPMGRLGTIEETAAIACWICSPEASFNTGFVFDLSGGRATY